MKKIFFLCLILFQCIQIHSQNSLKGTVKSKTTKENLPGAIIYFPDLKTGVASTNDGSYQINKLPKIKTLMQVKFLGYKTFVKQIDLATTQNFDIEMEESAIEADEVVVTGTSHATEIKRNPVPMVFN